MTRNLFWETGLSEPLIRNLEAIGFHTPTPIQRDAIPSVLQGHDICASAQTGSGKTASFLLPVIDKLLNTRLRCNMPRAIVLSPTRELAQQVSDNFKMFSEGLGLKTALLMGGEWAGEQEKQLRKSPDFIIATPGRLLDLYERGKIIMHDIQTLIIDEADRMLDMGFMPDVNRLLACLPKHRQIVLFSATFSKELQPHIEVLLPQGKRIESSVLDRPAETIEQYKVDVDIKNKRPALCSILKLHPGTSAIVFCNRKKDVDILSLSLNKHGFKSMPLHGDLTQSLRNETLERFRNEKGMILIASDIAARGIDIDDLPLVVNFDLPINAEDYVHRIGRTGRVGKKGLAFSFITDKDTKKFKAIQKLTGMTPENFELVLNTPKDPIADRSVRPSKRHSKDHSHIRTSLCDTPSFGFGDFVPRFILADPLAYFQCEPQQDAVAGTAAA